MDGDNISIEKIDVVFPVLHGKFGEDGTLQGLLEMSGIPYCRLRRLASAVCMDNVHANITFDKRGVPHCKWDFMMDYDMPKIEELPTEPKRTWAILCLLNRLTAVLP